MKSYSMMQLTNPKLIFCDTDNITAVRDALKQLDRSVPIFTFDGTGLGPVDIGDGTKHPLVIVCTSGSTGYPKGVSLSHAVALGQLTNKSYATSDDIMTCFSSLHWLSGVGTIMLTTFGGMTRVHPCMGYLTDAESSADAVDTDGWYHSGDVGHFDEDDYLFVVDRIKEILMYANYQISPSEIEEVILKHRGVTAVCVVGIPDLLWTDLPAAVVMKNDDFHINERKILDAVKNGMPDYKQLRGGVYFVNSLPITPSGKIFRWKVKEMAIEMYNQRSKAYKMHI